jgi:hypothetical protein
MTHLDDLNAKARADTQPVIEAARALAGLLRTAEDLGLPAPYSAGVTNYAPSGHPSAHEFIGGLSLAVDPDDLAAWSEWLDSEPVDDDEPYKGNVHRHVNGMVGPVPLQVTALVPVSAWSGRAS